ncbi:MAG: Peptide deformylase 1 [Elusimicrobia bacterium ADurb.Bin231]|nr:MAG: Peptide deformylase 1 [Elusimicrobia bacterium ADurb.Bin231]
MALIKILKYPDKVLKTPAERIKNINEDLIKLSKDMIETMYFFNGIGLAANQVGILKKMLVMDVKPDGKKSPVVIFNPEIIGFHGAEMFEEGCLSLPGISARVKRPDKVSISGLSPAGKAIEWEFEGMLARVVQHEIDHLNGVVFIDRVNPISKWKLKKEYSKKNNIVL